MRYLATKKKKKKNEQATSLNSHIRIFTYPIGQMRIGIVPFTSRELCPILQTSAFEQWPTLRGTIIGISLEYVGEVFSALLNSDVGWVIPVRRATIYIICTEHNVGW